MKIDGIDGRLRVLAGSLFLVSTTACGGDAETGPAARASKTVGDERVGNVTNQLVTGAFNVSSGIAPNSGFESETAAVAMGSQHFAAYNSSDLAHRNGDQLCLGYAGIAESYNTNGTWRGLRLPPPAGAAMLNADPAVAFSDGGSFWLVWVSALAISQGLWDTLFKDANGCVNKATINVQRRDRACLMTVLVPKDGSPAVPYLSQCMASGNDHLDGGALYITPNNHLFAAYWNVTRNRIDVFRDFVAVPSPFTGTMIGHPLLVPHAGSPTVIAPDSSGAFWVARGTDGTNPGWVRTRLTANGAYSFDEDVTLKDGKQIVDGRYSADMYAFPGTDQMFFFYPTRRVNGIKRLQGVHCGFQGLGGTCDSPSGWITPAGQSAIFPAVAIANVSFFDRRPAVSYWAENGPTNGRLNLMFGKINLSNNQFFIGAAPTGDQVPCTGSGGYWGDYDAMTVAADGTGFATLVRYFTDSTGATCGTGGDGLPMHVSGFATLP